DLLDRILLLDGDAEAVGEDALGIVAVLVGIREWTSDRLGGLDAREPVGMRLCPARPSDDVELVVVDGERERLDAQRAARALEIAVPDLQRAAALEGVDHFLEELFLLGQRLLAAPHQEDELTPEILEAL